MITISNVKHLKGQDHEGYTASVLCNEKRVNIMFDCADNNVIIHRWYRLTDDERKAVREEATRYFSSLAA